MNVRRDLVTSAAIGAVGLGYLVSALQLPASVRQTEALGPRAYPMLIAVLLILAAMGLAVGAGLRKRQVAQSGVTETEGVNGEATEAVDWPRLGIIVAATVVYLLLLDLLGFIIATTLYLIVGVLVAGRGGVPRPRELVAPAIFGVVVSVVTYVIFAIGLDLNLPVGSFLNVGW